MSNEKLTKKLALFHHPLFQNTCLRWRDCIGATQTSLNLITFAEINIRIQKTIMTEFNFENAFLSALNDWQQEVETLSSQAQQVQSPQKKSTHSKLKKDNELRAAFTKMLNEIPFEAGLPNDAYMDLFNTAKHHEAFNFVKDHISLSGFFKFLFDLGYSFCEELDIELFCVLLNGIFLQTTSMDTAGQRSLQNVKSITCLPNVFMTQHKLLKAHYNRYKKIDLGDYDKWYEWNYLPARIHEMKAKAKEILLNCFPSDQSISPFLDELYDDSISKIIQSDLIMPTLKHFTAQHESQKGGEYSMESLFSLNPHTIDHDTFIPLNRSPNNQKNVNAHEKVAKKLKLPIFGKTIPRPSPEEKIRTHTIKSITTFIDPTEEGSRLEPNHGLGPIWENELSETNSTDSRTNFYQPKDQDFGEDDSFSISKKKLENIPRYPTVSASMNFDQNKTMNQSDVTSEDMYSGFMTSFNSYQLIKHPKDTSNSSTIIKPPQYPPQYPSEAIPPRNRPLRVLAKIEEIASIAQGSNSNKHRNFGVFGVQPNGLVDLLDENRPPSTNLSKKRDTNRNTPSGMNSREASTEQRKGILRGSSQNRYRKSAVEDLTLVGRSASQAVDTGSLSSLNTSPDHKYQDSKEITLPVIEGTRQLHVSFKKPSYQVGSAEKQKSFNLYENVQFFGPDQILSKMKERSIGSAKIPALKVEKPKLEAMNFVWQVKENFNDKERDEFFEKMQIRQEKNKKRQENRSKSNANGKRKNRRDRSADVGARTKVFLNSQNRSLYKEVFIE